MCGECLLPSFRTASERATSSAVCVLSLKKTPLLRDRLDINEAIREVIEVTHGEAVKNGVSAKLELADGLPLVQGDRVHLQQVILNLIINAVDAMSSVNEGPRELLISSSKAESD